MPRRGNADLQRESKIQLGKSNSRARSRDVRPKGQRIEVPTNKRSEEEVTQSPKTVTQIYVG